MKDMHPPVQNLEKIEKCKEDTKLPSSPESKDNLS